jgi:spore coat protein CotH
MRRRVPSVVIALAGAVLSACAGGGPSASPTAANPTPTPTPSTGTTGAATDPIFDQGRLHEVRITIDPSDWAALQENFRTNQYYAADITLDSTVLQQVGIRSRGSGSRSEVKPALKVDFNKYVSTQEYGVYKTMVLDNQVQDPTFLRERLAFVAFEGMGIPAPQNAFARLFINGAYWGLYQVTEPISKPFLKARLGEESGNLFDYQYSFPWDFSFLSDDPEAYVPVPFEPQTNEDHLDASGLVDFIRTINGATDGTFTADMGAWLDRERFLTHLAVENAVAESDGIVGKLGANNFYLYQYGGQRRFVFLPWDKDSTFSASSQPVFVRIETNVLTRRLLADPAMQQLYVAALRRAVTSFVNVRYLTPRLETAYTQIREAALTDTHKPFTNSEFELGVGGLRGVIAAREGDVLGQTGGP